MGSPAVAAARQRLGLPGDKLTVIRVDRLDPSKNQLLGFRAFARLLELRPDLRGRVQFLAFLVPSRTDLSVYRAYREAIYQEVADVNGRFSVANGDPPITIYYTNDREQALAAMESCDVLLINALEDGMNLVAKEWAMVSRRPGALVLSESTGVAAEAQGSALFVAPLDLEGTARAMACAIDMPPAEREARLAAFRARVRQWTARDWLTGQLRDLGLTAPWGG
jgi:trehalose 6-phosphate synthase